jgi:hypothetical protein
MRLKHDDSVNRIIVEIDRNSSAQTGLPRCGAGMWLFCRKLRRFRLIFRQKRLSPPNSWHGTVVPSTEGCGRMGFLLSSAAGLNPRKWSLAVRKNDVQTIN